MSEHEEHPDHPRITSLDEVRSAKDEEIKDLIERSSLGTPDAKEQRAKTPPEVTERILRRAGVLPPEDHVAPVIDIDRKNPPQDQ